MTRTQIGITLLSFSLIIILYLIASLRPKSHLKVNIKKNNHFEKIRKNKNYYNSYAAIEKDKNGNFTLRQRLIYADINIPSKIFMAIEIIIVVVCFLITKSRLSLYSAFVMGWVGYILSEAFINYKIEKRFRAFDKDYPSYIQTMVSLLKSGMATMVAFEEAAKEFDDTSLVKKEVKRVSDSLRAGTFEDVAIGRFACTINHPEVELFVQAILSGKKLGGSLSDTLDRISKKARKKQIFRQSAKAAISQQRGSMYIVIVILIGIILFLGLKAPDLVKSLLDKPIIIEVGVSLNIFSIYLMNRSSKIKV